MSEFTFDKMQEMQRKLQDKYIDKWGGLYPEKGREMLLWMIGEIGEVSDVIKQNGDKRIMTDENIRRHFIEEMCDVMMYFNDVMLCYDISSDEFINAYVEKHNKNMERW